MMDKTDKFSKIKNWVKKLKNKQLNSKVVLNSFPRIMNGKRILNYIDFEAQGCLCYEKEHGLRDEWSDKQTKGVPQ